MSELLGGFALFLLEKGIGWIGKEAVDALGKPGRRRLAATALYKEWDDRLGPSRLWLMRANPEWTAPGQARRPFRFGATPRTAEDGEAAFHANKVLNFLEDLQYAIDENFVEIGDVADLCPTADLWWSRLLPLHDLSLRDKRSKGWPKAKALVKAIRRARLHSKTPAWREHVPERPR